MWEIVDNSVDEVINGFATNIKVTLHKDGKSVTVIDDGRGIPIDIKKEFKKSALELVLTTLHAGGKFSSAQYQFSGGLHGVGSSVVNALSEELVATIKRDGAEWEQTYERGKPTSKLRKVKAAKGTGTSIMFRPDPQIFGNQQFSTETIRFRLDAKAFLHKGLKITYRDEAAGTEEVFEHAGGIADFLARIVTDRGKAPTAPQVFYLERAGEGGVRIEAALQWTESHEETIRSYVNAIPTTQGGTHEQGFRAAIVKAVKSFIETTDLAPKGVTLTAEDIREGIVGVLSLYVHEPQFQGQTKERLGSPEAQNQVDSAVRPALEKFLLENRTAGAAIVERIGLAAKAREASRAAAQAVSRKTAVSHRLNLPGKLADCSSTDPGRSELFIVEGDSAGGSAKQGRERKTQAILPLRGKVLNTEQASLQKVLSNKELQDVVSALGCGVGEDFKIERLRYHKIVLLMDADSDGHHIATLLLTFFYRHLQPLIKDGFVYLAQPPLFRVDHGKETFWALDEADRDRIIAALPKNAKPEIMRFKGLGEMQPEELRRTTLDPATRRLLRVNIDNVEETDRILTELMGKDVEARFKFIMERAAQADLRSVVSLSRLRERVGERAGLARGEARREHASAIRERRGRDEDEDGESGDLLVVPLTGPPDMPSFSRTPWLVRPSATTKLSPPWARAVSGVVYLAQHRTIARRAAIKVLAPELSKDRDVVKRFFLEALATSLIQHPGIVEVYDYDVEASGRAYIVMEYLEGETLAACLERTRTLSWQTACAIAQRIASAVGAAHGHGVVHRDLKPGNVFVSRVVASSNVAERRIKVLDFGLAKLLADDRGNEPITRAGMLLGTPMYISPEQCTSSDQVTPSADIYALGCILYEMLCGKPPFEREGIRAILGRAHVRAAAARLGGGARSAGMARRAGSAHVGQESRGSSGLDGRSGRDLGDCGTRGRRLDLAHAGQRDRDVAGDGASDAAALQNSVASGVAVAAVAILPVAIVAVAAAGVAVAAVAIAVRLAGRAEFTAVGHRSSGQARGRRRYRARGARRDRRGRVFVRRTPTATCIRSVAGRGDQARRRRAGASQGSPTPVRRPPPLRFPYPSRSRRRPLPRSRCPRLRPRSRLSLLQCQRR